jgi:hypothetical protein
MVTKVDEAPMTAQYVQLFDQIWHNPDQLDDVTETVYDHIASVYAENSPERIYFLILYNLFRRVPRRGQRGRPPQRPHGLPGHGNLEGALRLPARCSHRRHQQARDLQRLHPRRQRRPREDVHGAGGHQVLRAPEQVGARPRAEEAVGELDELQRQLHHQPLRERPVQLRRARPHRPLADEGRVDGHALDRVNWGNYDLVVIDESHNFRNADYAEEKESRYQRLMREVIRQGVKTKVLMLSATPVNNRFYDLKNQLQLAYEGESDNLAKHLDLSTTIEKVFADAQRVFNEWSKLPVEERTTNTILEMLDFDFFELLDAVTIARSRKHIQAFYDMTEIGAFPERLTPSVDRKPLTDLPGVLSFNEIFDQLQMLNLSVYTPLAYVFPSRLAKYEALYNIGSSGSRANLGQQGREQGLKKLMTVNLLKRLESSVEAFRLTLAKIESAVDGTLSRLDQHTDPVTEFDVDVADLDADDDEPTRAAGLRGEDQDRPRGRRCRVVATRSLERPRDVARTP